MRAGAANKVEMRFVMFVQTKYILSLVTSKRILCLKCISRASELR